MCGRYTLSETDRGGIARRFAVDRAEAVPAATVGRFNVCPTEDVLVVTPRHEARAARWGIAAPSGRGPAPINARAESVAGRPFWARLLARRSGRVLVPADGWYEWLRPEDRKQPRIPFRYTVDGGALFAFAGLYDGEGAAVLTTTANAICAPVHDRMPCVLAGPEAEAAWLAGEDPLDVLVPLASERVSAAPANPAVNKAGVEGPELLVAPPPEEAGPANLALF
jgi:putative SOS response-associated peptidase YedK